MTTNDEYGKATNDLAHAEKLQEMMKQANAIIRSKKNVTERLMSEAGLSESNAMQIQQKDYAGRIGFPTYKLTNNNANISRLRERVNMLNDKLESAEKGNETYTFSEVGGGGTIEINYNIDRVQLLFPNGRVDNELYKKLRSNGYVYSPTNKAFQRKITPQAISNAIYLTKATKGEVAQQKADSLVNLTDADRQQMLESKKFSYVSGNIYNALPPSFKEYKGAQTFMLVYFSTVKENVKEGVKRYFKENMPIVDVEKITINVYPQTYVREAKKLNIHHRYLPSNAVDSALLSMKNQLDSYQKMSDRVDEESIETEGINDSDVGGNVSYYLTRMIRGSGIDRLITSIARNDVSENIEKNKELVKSNPNYNTPEKWERQLNQEISDYQDKIAKIEKDNEKWVKNGGDSMKKQPMYIERLNDIEALKKLIEVAENLMENNGNLENIDNKQHSLSKESPKEEIYSSFNDATIDQIIENIQDEVYANWQGDEPREREVKNSIWREVNKMNLRQENKTNLLDAVYQKMYNKKEKINEISYLYDEKTKELPEMNNKNFEEIERLKKEIANGERLMSNINFSGDVANEINRWKKQLAELEGKENSNSGKKIEDLSDLHELDLWKKFPDGRLYRKFNLPNDNRFRGFTDNGVKEIVGDLKNGRVSVILSVQNGSEANRVSQEFMETYPIVEKNIEEGEKIEKAELEGKENSNSGKIPVKFITLQIRDDRSQQQKYSDYDYDGANDKMRWLLDNKKFSDLNYNIEFEDGETLSGVIDCEPREFFKGVANPFTRHLNTFWGNVAKKGAAFMGAGDAQQAKELVEKYDLGEVKASESKIEKEELVKLILLLPKSIIDLINYLNKEDDAKKKAERWNEQRGLLLPKLGRTLWQIVMNVPYIEVGRSGDESRVHFSGNDLLRAIDKVYKENDIAFDQFDYGNVKDEPKSKESKPFGLTTIEYLDGGKTVAWGTKTRRGRETVIGKSNSDIKEEIESIKEYIVIGEIELKKAQEQYDKVKGIGSPTMYKIVADALSNLKMIERTLYVNKNILLPFFEKNIGEGEELVIEETTKDEIGDVTELTDAELKKYLDMLTLKDVRRAIRNAEGLKIAIENEIKKRSTNNLAKDIEETTYSQFKGVHHSYKNQYVLNKAIEELLMTKDGDYSSEEKLFIRKYSGYGGLEKYGKGGKGAFFEYYTPTEIIERMWGLAYKYGYNNGSVLEPSVGTGEFFRYAPKDAKLVGYEISEYSGKICKILYPTAEINIQPFEKTFIKNNFTVKGRLDDLEKFSLVIGNPPYGDFSTVESRYMSGMGEKDYTEARNYVEYFIRRGIDLLESGGLLIFIIGASLKNGGTMFLDSDMSPVKKWLSENCTLETAYRLPDSVFERTGVTADIIVLKKN